MIDDFLINKGNKKSQNLNNTDRKGLEQPQSTDWFNATTVSSDLTVDDFKSIGLTSENVTFKSKAEYLDNESVRNFFKDQDGKFNEEVFNKYYQNAAVLYQKLDEETLKEDYINDVFYKGYYDDLNGKPKKQNWEFNKLPNPQKLSIGLTEFNKYGKPTLSVRELAQQSLVIDSETGETLDYKPNDLNFLTGAINEPLVLAQWDTDNTTIDPDTGEEIKHYKGEYKLNKNNEYYYETLGKRGTVGKDFLSYWDTITTDGTWANSIDFMDSDGLDKSVVGTIAKTTAILAPLFIPGVNVYYGGITAGFGLVEALPIFLKAAVGLVSDEDDSKKNGLWQALNKTEAFAGKFTTSLSDTAKENSWGLESILSLSKDVGIQLMQQRALAQIPQYLGMNKGNKIYKNFIKKHGDFYKKTYHADLVDDIAKNTVNPVFLENGIPQAVMKQIQLANKNYAWWARNASIGYMSLTSASSTYNTMKEAGFNDVNSAIGLFAVGGAYQALMSMTSLGDIALKGLGLDDVRHIMKKSVIQESVKFMESSGLKQAPKEFATKFQKVLHNKVHKLGTLLKDSTEISGVLQNMLLESIEETSEELMEDGVKVTIDAINRYVLNPLGTGQKEDTYKYTLSHVFNETNPLQRYLLSAVGGALGGGMFKGFEAYESKVLKKGPAILPTNVQKEFIQHIQDGRADELIKTVEKIAKSKAGLASKQLGIDFVEDANGNKIYQKASSPEESQNTYLKNIIIENIRTLDSLLSTEGILDSDDALHQAFFRVQKVEKLQRLGLDTTFRADYGKAVVNWTNSKIELSKLKAQVSTDEQSKLEIDNSISKLEATIAEQKKVIDSFVNGDYTEKYINQIIFASNKAVNLPFYEEVLDDDVLFAEFKKDDWSEDFMTRLKTLNATEKAYNNYLAWKDKINIDLANNKDKYTEFADTYGKYGEKLGLESIEPFFISETDGNILEEIPELESSLGLTDNDIKFPNGSTGNSINTLIAITDKIDSFLTQKTYSSPNVSDEEKVRIHNIETKYLKRQLPYLLNILQSYTPGVEQSLGIFKIKTYTERILEKVRLDKIYTTNRSEFTTKVEKILPESIRSEFLQAESLEEQLSILETVPKFLKGHQNVLDVLNNFPYIFQLNNSGELVMDDDLKGNEISPVSITNTNINALKSLVNDVNNEFDIDNISENLKSISTLSTKTVAYELVLQSFDDKLDKNKFNKLFKEYISKDGDVEYSEEDVLFLRNVISDIKKIKSILSSNTSYVRDTESFELFSLTDSINYLRRQYGKEELPSIDSLTMLYMGDSLDKLSRDLGDMISRSEIAIEDKMSSHKRTFIHSVHIFNNVLDKLDVDMPVHLKDQWDNIKDNNEITEDNVSNYMNYIVARESFIREHFSKQENHSALTAKLDSILKGFKEMQNEPSVWNSETESLTALEEVSYIFTTIVVDNNTFHRKLKLFIENDNELTPTFMQIQSAKNAIATLTVNKKSDIFKLFSKSIQSVSPAQDINGNKSSYLDTCIVYGEGGTGKTKMVARIINEFISKDASITFVGPEQNQANNLQKSFGDLKNSDTVDKKTLLTDIFGNDEFAEVITKPIDLSNNDNPYITLVDEQDIQPIIPNSKITPDFKAEKIFFIDEISHFSEIELRFIRNKYPNCKIVGFGDTYQTQASYLFYLPNSANTIATVASTHNTYFCNSTPMMTISMRTENTVKKANQVEIRSALALAFNKLREKNFDNTEIHSKLSKLAFKFFESEDGSMLHGDYIVNNEKEFNDKLSWVENNKTEDETVLIIIDDKSDIKLYDKYKDNDKYLIRKISQIQGLEADYCIVDSNLSLNLQSESISNIITSLKTLYTLSSRAKKATIYSQRTNIKGKIKSLKNKFTLNTSFSEKVLATYKRFLSKVYDNINAEIKPIHTEDDENNTIETTVNEESNEQSIDDEHDTEPQKPDKTTEVKSTDHYIKTLYLPCPNGNVFYDYRAETEEKSEKSYYKFELINNTEAEFSFISNPYTVANAKQYRIVVIEDACTYKIGISYDTKKITTLEKGIARLKGDEWIITKKAIIKYESGNNNSTPTSDSTPTTDAVVESPKTNKTQETNTVEDNVVDEQGIIKDSLTKDAQTAQDIESVAVVTPTITVDTEETISLKETTDLFTIIEQKQETEENSTSTTITQIDEIPIGKLGTNNFSTFKRSLNVKVVTVDGKKSFQAANDDFGLGFIMKLSGIQNYDIQQAQNDYNNLDYNSPIWNYILFTTFLSLNKERQQGYLKTINNARNTDIIDNAPELTALKNLLVKPINIDGVDENTLLDVLLNQKGKYILRREYKSSNEPNVTIENFLNPDINKIGESIYGNIFSIGFKFGTKFVALANAVMTTDGAYFKGLKSLNITDDVELVDFEPNFSGTVTWNRGTSKYSGKNIGIKTLGSTKMMKRSEAKIFSDSDYLEGKLKGSLVQVLSYDPFENISNYLDNNNYINDREIDTYHMLAAVKIPNKVTDANVFIEKYIQGVNGVNDNSSISQVTCTNLIRSLYRISQDKNTSAEEKALILKIFSTFSTLTKNSKSTDIKHKDNKFINISTDISIEEALVEVNKVGVDTNFSKVLIDLLNTEAVIAQPNIFLQSLLTVVSDSYVDIFTGNPKNNKPINPQNKDTLIKIFNKILSSDKFKYGIFIQVNQSNPLKEGEKELPTFLTTTFTDKDTTIEGEIFTPFIELKLEHLPEKYHDNAKQWLTAPSEAELNYNKNMNTDNTENNTTVELTQDIKTDIEITTTLNPIKETQLKVLEKIDESNIDVKNIKYFTKSSNGLFTNDMNQSTLIDGSSIYEFEVLEDGTAAFSIINSIGTIKSIKSDLIEMKSMLNDATNITADIITEDANIVELRTIKKGKAVLEDNNWRITEKAIIRAILDTDIDTSESGINNQPLLREATMDNDNNIIDFNTNDLTSIESFKITNPKPLLENSEIADFLSYKSSDILYLDEGLLIKPKDNLSNLFFIKGQNIEIEPNTKTIVHNNITYKYNENSYTLTQNC